MKKKIIVLIISALFFFLNCSLHSLAEPFYKSNYSNALLDVYYENGKWIIENIGDETAENVVYSKVVTAMLVFAGKSSSGNIGFLEPGEKYVILEGLLFGFGLAKMTLTVDADNAETCEREISGLLFGMFFILI